MKPTLIYIGLDVDDTQFHGSALDEQTGEVLGLNCRPILQAIIDQLEKISKRFPGCELRLC